MEARKNLQCSTATITTRLGGTSNASPEVDNFVEAERVRLSIMARTAGNHFDRQAKEDLIKALALYKKALSGGNFRAICSTNDPKSEEFGGLYSLNGMLNDTGLFKTADAEYFNDQFAQGLNAHDPGCLRLQQELDELTDDDDEQLSVASQTEVKHHSSDKDEWVYEELSEKDDHSATISDSDMDNSSNDNLSEGELVELERQAADRGLNSPRLGR